MGRAPAAAWADLSNPNEQRSSRRCASAPTPMVFALAKTPASRARTGRRRGCLQKQSSPHIRRVQYTVLSVAGLKGTMSEAELHIIRARLDGGIRNKAARGELRRGLPVGFVWGEQDGEVLFHPDEAVTGAIRTVFERFAEFGSAPRVWLWFRSEGLFRCKRRPPVYLVRSAGSFRLTPRSTTSSPIRCMLALTPTARPNTNTTSMNMARSENGFDIFPWISGRCSFRTIMPASSIGPPFKPIRHGSTPTPDRSRISQEAR